MTDQIDVLTRIAAALERLAPPPAPAVNWLAHPAYVWTGSEAREVTTLEAPKLAMLRSCALIRHCESYLKADPRGPEDDYVSVLPLPWIMEQLYVLGWGLIARMRVNFVEEPETTMADFGRSPKRDKMVSLWGRRTALSQERASTYQHTPGKATPPSSRTPFAHSVTTPSWSAASLAVSACIAWAAARPSARAAPSTDPYPRNVPRHGTLPV